MMSGHSALSRARMVGSQRTQWRAFNPVASLPTARTRPMAPGPGSAVRRREFVHTTVERDCRSLAST